MGWRVCDIASLIGEKEKTVHSWKARDEWDRADTVERIGGALEARLAILIHKEGKTGGDFKEIDLLHRQLERQARIQRYQGGGNETDLNPAVANRNASPKKKARKNEFSEEEIERLQTAFVDGCFDYQRDWYRAGNERTRIILKSRQIGATYYFAREALIDALTTGRNQIFLSASKSQAHIFLGYMRGFVREVLDRDLTGDPITLANGAELFFLGTNARTAQGYHGNFYFDESGRNSISCCVSEFTRSFEINNLNCCVVSMAPMPFPLISNQPPVALAVVCALSLSGYRRYVVD